MQSYLMKRLSEPSSWRGLVAILTAAGVALTPSQANAVIALGLAVIGAIGAFTPDPAR